MIGRRFQYQATIELVQHLAATCRVPGLLAQTWGSHGLSSEGVLNRDGPLDHRNLASKANEYARRHLHDLIRRCEPYFVDQDVLSVIEAQQAAVPGATRLHEGLFPTPFGCLFFARPVKDMLARHLHHLPGLPTHEPAPLSGFAWQLDSSLPANMTATQHHLVGDELVAERPVGGGVTLVYIYSWAVDQTTPTYVGGTYIGNIPLTILPWEFATDTARSYINRHNEKVVDDDDANVRRFEHSTRIVLATLHYMNETIVSRSRQPVDRASRKRVLKAGWTRDPSVQVITLRRVRAEDGHEPRAVDWACRWLVRPHTRTLRRGTPEQRTVQVRGHVKGPPERPLKVSAPRVWAVIR